MLNAIDQAIYDGRPPDDPGEVPEGYRLGSSYYWDIRERGATHEEAVKLAAIEMGSAVDSLYRLGVVR